MSVAVSLPFILLSTPDFIVSSALIKDFIVTHCRSLLVVGTEDLLRAV